MGLFKKDDDSCKSYDLKQVTRIVVKIRNLDVTLLPDSTAKDIELQIVGAVRGMKETKMGLPDTTGMLRIEPEVTVEGIPLEVKCVTEPVELGWIIGQACIYLEKYPAVIVYIFDGTANDAIKEELLSQRGKDITGWLKNRGIFFIVK